MTAPQASNSMRRTAARQSGLGCGRARHGAWVEAHCGVTPLGQIQRYRGLTAASHNPNFPR
jgi:hypothetical protein